MQTSQIEHLVLSGGGLLGISYIGLFRYLEEQPTGFPILKSITGCSAGAMFGTLLAIGYKHNEMQTIVNTINFKEYININVDSILNFMRTKGLETGNNLINLIKKCIKDKTGDENITFIQIKEKYNINLQIGVTNLTKSKFELCNYTNTPNIQIHQAIRASIAIPFIFEPVVIGDEIFCDGGLLDNLPIEDVINMENIMANISANISNIVEKSNSTKNTNTNNNTNINTPEISDSNDSNDDINDAKDKKNDTTDNKIIVKNTVNILGVYLIGKVDTVDKNNYQTISILQYVSVMTQALSRNFINKKKEIKNYIKNKDNTNHKIILFEIPCDIMTFIKINASPEDVKNIIDIAYNTTKLEMSN